MVDHIILILTLVAISQPDKDRRIAAGVFCLLTILHSIVATRLDGFPYYSSAAVFDLAIIFFLSKLKSNIVVILQKVCVVSIIVNFIGWVTWYCYLPPDAYNIAFIFIYSWVLILLLQKGNYVGNIAMGGLCTDFYVDPTRGTVASASDYRKT